MMVTCHHSLSKPTECAARRVNPKVNGGHGAMTLCQCKFVLGADVPLVSDAGNGGVCSRVEAGDRWESSVVNFKLI